MDVSLTYSSSNTERHSKYGTGRSHRYRTRGSWRIRNATRKVDAMPSNLLDALKEPNLINTADPKFDGPTVKYRTKRLIDFSLT